MENKINIIAKQNDAIYNSLISKNIIFERTNIDEIIDLDEKYKLLMLENTRMKHISKNSRLVQVKEIKPIQKIDNESENKNKNKKNEDEEVDDQQDDNYEDIKKKFNTITNMEDIKRAFFTNELSSFEELTLQQPFKYYEADYKYSNEKDGAADYIAKNLLKGFVRNLEDYRKYLFVCFRCKLIDQDNKKYEYKSLWILNSNESFKDIIGDIYDDFEFTEINENNIKDFLNNFKKIEIDDDLVNEIYLH